jgi:hypothetical protein
VAQGIGPEFKPQYKKKKKPLTDFLFVKTPYYFSSFVHALTEHLAEPCLQDVMFLFKNTSKKKKKNPKSSTLLLPSRLSPNVSTWP